MQTVGTAIQLSMAATVQSEWIDLRSSLDASLQVSCGDNSSPVGAITVEYSNDVNQILDEKYRGTLPSATAAARVDVTSALTVLGTALSTSGYDGAGSKASFIDLDAIGMPAFVRVVYTRTSGGASDTLLVNVSGRE